MTHTAKINSREIFAFAQPRNFLPAKISSIKVDFYVERPIIWDIYNKGYHKREKRDVAFSKLSGEQ